MPSIRFTPEQTAELRRALGVPDGEADPTPDDLIAVLEAQAITDAAARPL